MLEAEAINMPLLAELGVRVGAWGYKHAAPGGAISAPEPPKRDSRNIQYHSVLRSERSVRSGMFIATGTNNDLRKLRQERHVIEPDRMDWLVGVAGGNRPGP